MSRTSVVFLCSECRTEFAWAIRSAGNHWSSVFWMEDRPVYCSCCGSFHSVIPVTQAPDNSPACKLEN